MRFIAILFYRVSEYMNVNRLDGEQKKTSTGGNPIEVFD